jgi:four helix bundle protein
MFNFEKLEIYQDALALIKDIYRISSLFPRSEQFSLSQQLKRAVTSVAINIAEGNGRSRTDNLNFLRFSRGSLFETTAILQICVSLDFLSKEDYLTLYERCESLAKRIGSFMNALKTNS